MRGYHGMNDLPSRRFEMLCSGFAFSRNGLGLADNNPAF